MDKSPDAFRTISEVADFLETPAHVLRFWESRFPQIRPVKRAGGRRYYRPADVALLTGIKRLLHDEGLTIRGVQKILREHGVRHVSGLSGEDLLEDADQDAEAALEAALALNFGLLDDEEMPPEKAESATIVALETALRRAEPNAAAAGKIAGKPAEIITAFESPPAAKAAPPLAPVVQDLFADDLFADDLGAPFSDGLSADGPDLPDDMADLDLAARPAAVALFPADASVAARLRALPRNAFDTRQPQARALRDRLLALQARMQAGPDLYGTQP